MLGSYTLFKNGFSQNLSKCTLKSKLKRLFALSRADEHFLIVCLILVTCGECKCSSFFFFKDSQLQLLSFFPLLITGEVFYRDFENDILGTEDGERVSDVEPFLWPLLP